MYTVYMHITPSGKKYIGLTSMAVEERWASGRGYQTQLFGRAVKKYGWENIEHIILATDLSKEAACDLEQLLIKIYNTQNPKFGYNISDGGDCSALGMHHTEETKRKLAQASKGRVVSEETRKKLSAAFKGRPISEDQKQRLREINLGKHHSEETKRKISEAGKGKHCGKDNPMYGKGFFGKDNPMYGKHLSEEAKKHLSDINKGELNHFYGKHHTEESLQKMRGPRKPLGKQSPEHVRKRVEARRKTLELKKKLAEEQVDKAMNGAD
ncbi:MAG: hypothetical protein J6W84_06360 [Bacteroidales bacterium]|nr:hypothetical protein [Bacteroidales bacterium]